MAVDKEISSINVHAASISIAFSGPKNPNMYTTGKQLVIM